MFFCTLGLGKLRVERWKNTGRLEHAHKQMCGVKKRQLKGSGA